MQDRRPVQSQGLQSQDVQRQDRRPGNDNPRPINDGARRARNFGSARTRDVYERAARHSRRVATFRKVLPLAALFLAGIVGGYIWLSQGDDGEGFSIESVSVSNSALTMTAPTLRGGSEDQAYRVTARQATQSLETPHIIGLNHVDARLTMASEGWAQLFADTGTFDREARTLQLVDNIVITSSQGYRADLKTASVDLDAGNMTSKDIVVLTGPTSALTADSVTVENRGDVIRFTGTVRMTIRPQNDEKSDQTTDARN